MTQKRDLRENRCFITFFSAAKVSNTKAFIDRSRSVTLIDPMTRGLKVQIKFTSLTVKVSRYTD